MGKSDITLVSVTGTSMLPTIKQGEFIEIGNKRYIRYGDIALINGQGCFIVHRIVGKVRFGKNTWYIHKGDNSRIVGIAHRRDILGIAVKLNTNSDYSIFGWSILLIIRYLKRLLLFAHA